MSLSLAVKCPVPSRLAPLCLGVALTVLPPCSAAQNRPDAGPIGLVSEAKGIWTRPQDGKVLTRGDWIFPGQSVTTEQTTAASISVVLLATGKIWEQRCLVANPCTSSFRPPQPEEHPTGVWAYVKSYVHPDTTVPVVFAGSRGVAQTGPHFALLPVTHEQVDLSPALATVNQGHYNYLLTRTSSQDADEAVIPIGLPIVWKGEPLAVQAPASGLFALQLFSGTERVGEPAAVLIVRDDATRDEQIWRGVKEQSSGWTRVSPEVIDAMLLSILCALPAR